MGEILDGTGGDSGGKGGGGDGIEPVDLRSALEERYLAYALSTIMHRALPDVRDGLKPVHRRIMHAMRLLRLDPDRGFVKCARIVGDVMGKFHPHGDSAIYDALVRLAQSFSVRYPLVDGQGNFGNVDGDNAAAMRYTEARMTEVATLLLEGITEDAVDFRATYNEEDQEPSVLPGAFPNLLANGSSGIAVGMATNIPPHNAAEICDAALHLIAHPEATSDDLLQFVPGPDFPTGGIVVESQVAIAEAYRTGRGGFRTRARWHREDQGRGVWQVVVTEIPYQVAKSKLIEKIAELLTSRKLPLLEDVSDESAEDIRIVLTPKSRSVDPDLLMESLFKLTELESRVSLNMNVLSHGKVPNVLSLEQCLRQWLDHRREVLQRRSRYRLEQIAKRLEILGGYLVAYLNLDEVIRIIREEDEPKKELIAAFELNDTQAEAILNMRLRNLRKLEEMEIRKEYDKLEKEQSSLQTLLGSEKRQWTRIGKEIEKVREKFGPETELGRRRTSFATAPSVDLTDIQQAMIEKEPVTVIVSSKGWLRALKGHIADTSNLAFKDGDSLLASLHAQTTDRLLVMTTDGRVYTIGVDRLPGGRGHGEPIRIMVDMDNAAEIAATFIYRPKGRRLMVSAAGNGFVVEEETLLANTRKGKQTMNVKDGDRAIAAIDAEGSHVAMIGENRKMLVFPLSQVAVMSRGKGVRLQRYGDGGVSDVKVFRLSEGLTWVDSAGRQFTRSVDELLDWRGDRAMAGRLAPKGFPKSGKFAG